ncbi:MAG: 23S rRNA (adenine(2503)-C(2))-methyltransferase RlmN [Myxococcales bacterium]|jgi:23S rRNA (adenine2503-C2)-methyltransferase|nr:23S rRNA (adenine(2503)-C(2))-methyltransferase RlmN [Myxococcales bacterium]
MLPETSQTPPTDLRGLSRDQLSALVARLGEKPFRARQLFAWLHGRGARSLDEMTDLSRALRERLASETHLTTLAIDETQLSNDGTRKFRFRTEDSHFVEAVFLPEDDRRTLCVSTQVGCPMGCAFCRTARSGLTRNLTTSEILAQVYEVNRAIAALGVEGKRPLTNLVFMGMGEPFLNFDNLLAALALLQDDAGLNFSRRHITVSTSGIVPMIERFGALTENKLAVSLNASSDAQREALMPVNRRYPLAELLAACRRFPLRQGRRITFEYVLLDEINDSMDDARRVARLLRGIEAKVNLIPYNESPGLPFRSVPIERAERFRDLLLGQGLVAVIRKNRGRDILAACGQLAAKGSEGLSSTSSVVEDDLD